jgi:enoyl-CoA hydratase
MSDRSPGDLSEIDNLERKQRVYKYLTVEEIDEGQIVRITLNRPETRNAQNRGLLVELDEAMRLCEADDRVLVIILAGAGPMFSSGHDLGSADRLREMNPGPDQHLTYRAFGGTRQAAERRMLQEWQFFYENTRHWRNLRKITIAQVHGKVLAAGLMLMWCCDLIVAANDAMFADIVGTRLGMCGVEYFAHPWEFGPRKTKYMMLTGDSMGAQEAYQLGMIAKLCAPDELEEETLALGRVVTTLPSMTSLLIKESVNQTVDTMGFSNALNSCFSLHQLNHSHWAEVTNGESIVAPPESFNLPN